jgi:hypothetical protein
VTIGDASSVPSALMFSEGKHPAPAAPTEILCSESENRNSPKFRRLFPFFLPTLVLSEHFLPHCGGCITWLFQTYSRYSSGEAVVVVGERGDTMLADQNLPFKVERIRMSMNHWDPARPASLARYFDIFLGVRKIVRRYQVSQIHCIKVLPEGLVAWCMQRLAQHYGVREDVVFAGSISDGDRAVYYAACDLFLMPNRQIGADIEGFGIVFLEAGAAGKPVIGGKSGGTGEAIIEGVTGVRVEGESVEAVAAAVIDLLAHPEKARAMGERGRLRVETEFNWEAVVERTRQVASTLVRAV